MPNGFLINENLEPETRNRVTQRLNKFGFVLTDWPKGAIKDAINPDDVAIFVISSATCSAEEQRRFEDAVTNKIPIISILLDKLIDAPGAVGDYSSSTVNIDIEELGDILTRAKTIYKSSGSEPADKTKIKHNKC